MVSFAARAIEAGIWMWASGLRKKTEAESVQIVIEQTEKNAAAVVLPSKMKYTQNQEQLSGHQEWQVFHLEPKSSARTDSVVVFWHGGGFVNNVGQTSRLILIADSEQSNVLCGPRLTSCITLPFGNSRRPSVFP